MPITLGTNMASLMAQRQLGKSTESIGAVFERLSSGMRINKASDDAAGLAISDSLKTDVRVYTKGIANLNDGISALMIADSMLAALSDVLARQAELAEQAANGTVSRVQRVSMQQEADALTQEMNRIIQSTRFNGIDFYNQGQRSLSLQAGYSSIATILGSYLSQDQGVGSFTASTTTDFSSGGAFGSPLLVDLDGDGNQDIVIGRNSAQLRISFGNGDGSFGAQQVLSTSASLNSPVYAYDYDSDGDNDLVFSNTNGINVIAQTSSRNFAATSVVSAAITSLKAVGDFNGDGVKDFYGNNGSNYYLMNGNANGTFSSAVTTTAINFFSTESADFNGDGRADLFVNGGGGGLSHLYLARADGTFTRTFSATFGEYHNYSFGDLNRDGILDVAFTSTQNDRVYTAFGNGDGTFKTLVSLAVGANDPNGISITDFDGDGVNDLVYYLSSNTTIGYRKGNGDGTFGAERTTNTVTSFPDLTNNTAPRFVVGDVNNDGVTDILTTGFIAGGGTGVRLYTQDTTKTNLLDYVNISTQLDARSALDKIKSSTNRINLERSLLGAYQSRVHTSIYTLNSSVTNADAARSRIVDVDVAEEAAHLVKNQILQKMGSAILAQSNLIGQLVLKLLK